jgi:hypothetical protein
MKDETKPSASATWKLYAPYVALLLLALAWSGYWYVASRASEQALDSWFAQERSFGRVWSCGERMVGGYPFRVELRCSNPSFEGRLGAAQGRAQIGDLLAASHLYNPKLIVGEFKSPLKFQAQDHGVEIAAQWSKLLISHRLGPVPGQTSVEMDDAVLRLQDAALQIDLRSEKFEFHLRPTPDMEGALDLALRLGKLQSAPLDQLTGESSAVDAVLSVTFAQSRAFKGANLAQSLESWRQAQGTLTINELKMAKANARLEIKGPLSLDEQRRIRGKLDIDANGLGKLLAAQGIPALSNLRLPLTLENGRASLGPLRLNVPLSPLY